MDWLANALMFAWYASVLVVIGAVGAVRVAAGQNGIDAHGWAGSALRLSRVIVPLVIFALLGRLWLQTWQAFGSDQPLTLQHAVVIIRETPWGGGWLWQTIAGMAAWMVIALASPRHWRLLLVAAAGLGGTVGMTGHAAGADSYAGMVITAHGLHVLAAGLWLGTLAVILRVTRRAAARDQDVRRDLAYAIGRFSPQAVLAVSVLAVSGVVAAWQHVSTFDSLFTPYGFVLVAKVVAFGAAALCGLYNWRVVRPSLAAQEDALAQMRGMASLELAFGFIALVLTSILTSMPMPTHE